MLHLALPLLVVFPIFAPADYAGDRSTETNVATTQSLGESTKSRADSDRATELSEKDLEAQQSMAKAAWFMLGVASAQALISAVGIWFIWATLDATRRSVAASEIAAEASRAAADAAIAGASTARELSNTEARPWLSIECSLASGFWLDKTHCGVEGYYLELAATAKNHGHAPATHVTFHAEIGLQGRGRLMPEEQMAAYCDEWRSRSDNYGNHGAAIFPDSSSEVAHTLFLPSEEIEKALQATEFKHISPVIYGCVNYRSGHTDGVRQTRFVYNLTAVKDERAVILQPSEPDWTARPIALIVPPHFVTAD